MAGSTLRKAYVGRKSLESEVKVEAGNAEGALILVDSC